MAQQPAAPDSQPPPIDDSITAAESDAPARRLVSFNEYEGPLGSIRIGIFENFDSLPPPGLSRNDYGWSNSFGLKF